MLIAYLSGLGIGAGMIIAIGSQNAFVLMQSLKQEHHMVAAGICAVLDVILIAAGVFGMGAFIQGNATLHLVASLGGAAFLFVFGLGSLRAAFSGKALAVVKSEDKKSLGRVIATTLAISLLNPHVYIDTVISLGAISTTFAPPANYVFGLGCLTISFIWFFGLAFAGKKLIPLFAKPQSWRVLHLLVCGMVWLVAVQLVIFALW